MNIKTGVILAAGLGSRLNEITRAVPKELLTVGGTPIIKYTLESMIHAGVEKLIVVVGYHKKAIIDYIGSGQIFGLNVAYVFQEKQMGTGNALLYAENFVDENFCLMFGDDYLEPQESLKELCASHNNDRIATVGVSKVDDASTTSVFRTDNQKVLEILEKPNKKELWGNIGSNGSFVLNRKIFDIIRATKPGINEEIFLSDALQLAIKNDQKVFAIENASYYMDIGIMDRYLDANRRIFKNI